MLQQRVFSGVQPTGNLHLGNYLGAIKQWVSLQEQYECLFCIVDYHAITVAQDPHHLRRATLETAAAYIAAGIDAEKQVIFTQSSVNYHTELAWILNCHTPLGWLNRMTQFKEKAGKDREKANAGLYTYPILMAADILLYHATHVPVGEDQKQHLELAREIASSFNNHYFDNNKGTEAFFPLPEPLILGAAPRVMSLRDGTKKMSKSDESDYSRITLTDDADTIVKKIMKAKSDVITGLSYDKENRPEASNLLTIYTVLSGQTLQATEAEFASTGFGDFKKRLAELCVTTLAPITAEMNRLKSDESYLVSVLARGTEKARSLAGNNMGKIKEVVGFLKVNN